MRSLMSVWLGNTIAVGAALLGAGCGDSARLTVTEGMGTQPVLPAPNPSLIPVIDIAPAIGWSNGRMPSAADGLIVAAFARDLDHPRWLHVLPNGDVLVAETNAPERENARTGIKGAIMGLAMKRAGSATPSADRITLLRDSDGNGEPELRTTFAADLHSPFGMALVGERFLRGQYRRAAALRLSTERYERGLARLSTSRRCRPERSTTTGRKTSSPTAMALAST